MFSRCAFGLSHSSESLWMGLSYTCTYANCSFTPFFAKLKFCKVAQWSEWTALFEVQCPILYWIEIWALSWQLQNIHLVVFKSVLGILRMYGAIILLENKSSQLIFLIDTESDRWIFPYFACKSSRHCSWSMMYSGLVYWCLVLLFGVHQTYQHILFGFHQRKEPSSS